MDKFLERGTIYQDSCQPIKNHEEVEDLNRPIISKNIQSVIKNLPRKKRPGTHGFPVNFTKHLEKN